MHRLLFIDRFTVSGDLRMTRNYNIT